MWHTETNRVRDPLARFSRAIGIGQVTAHARQCLVSLWSLIVALAFLLGRSIASGIRRRFAIAGECRIRSDKALRRRAIHIKPLRLEVWPFVPRDSEPPQAVKYPVHEIGPIPLHVCVFNAKQQRAAVALCE